MENVPEAAKPEQQSQVTAQLERIDRDLNQTHDSVALLEGRLRSVLHDVPPSENSKGDQPELVPLAELLMTFATRVSYINTRMNHILEHLEL